ncbi:hypothetical protein Q6346_11930 [Isoptericola sp. b490]|uniref:hypothetical protein n=1 Tax=Actinotalea lenta TaxID=3064654 RepID=UPI0027141788|nr:hypothetical protein [Isoptericola sp. b490]MDO8122019.1 hypothetical protein [Isoptericola sp. b490]
MRAARWMAAGTAVAATLALAACAGTAAPPTRRGTTASDTPAPTTTSAAQTPARTRGQSPTTAPSSALSSEASSAPRSAEPVALSAHGVGDVAWDTPEATTAVEALLGPPDSIEPFPSQCGLADVEQLSYGGVTINVLSDALFSWTVTQAEPTPTGIALPHGIAIGSPWSAVTALPGAQPATTLENYQVAQVQVGSEADSSLFYWAPSDVPDSRVVLVAARHILGCG